MRLSSIAIICLAACQVALPEVSTAQPAFPTVVGFGAQATGWRGGRIVKVTNTNDTGAGSLRECAETPGPKVCLFDTGGTIAVDAPIRVTANTYLAGQSAPDDSGGIQIRLDPSDNESASPIIIDSADDVLLRHLRVRPGPGLTSTAAVDAVTIQDSSRVVLDHMSLFYATDENFNVDADSESVRDITIQHSITAFALRAANHPQGDHSKGMLICSIRQGLTNAGGTCGNITIAYNIFAHNRDRNPDLEASGLPVEAYNNIIYNPGTETFEIHDGNGSTASFSIMNNLEIDGSNTIANMPFLSVFDDLNDQGLAGEVEGRVYVRGNLDGTFRTDSGDDEDDSISLTNRDTILSAPEGSVSGPMYAAEDLQAVLPGIVGATKPVRDALDIIVTNQVTNGSGGSDKNDPSGINVPGGVAGYPTLAAGTAETDTDGDGMPDSWEFSFENGFFLATQFDAWGDRDGDGWSNIEQYLNFLAGDIPDPRT